jgi:hypothetical protein
VTRPAAGYDDRAMGWRPTAWVAALLACGAVVAGCGGGATAGAGAGAGASATPGATHHLSPPSASTEDTHTLKFQITGSGSIASMTYTVSGKTGTGADLSPPWSRTFELPAHQGTQSWDLDLKGVSGSADVVVTLDDSVFSRSSVSGGECHTSGSVEG